MTDNYTILISKLDEFIRKYYKNRLLKGFIYSFSLLLAFFLITNSIEYFAQLDPLPRTILFYFYLLANLAILFRLILIPLFKLYRIGKIITHEQAAHIIGRHFSNVKDRLLNTLQLKQMQDFNPENTGLIEASINQKIIELRPVPFSAAIDFKQNRKYLRFVFPPLVILIIILLAAPSFITEPADRLIHHQVYYEKKAPFQVIVLNSKLQAIQQEDFDLNLKIIGDQVPDNLLIEYENAQYRLSRESNILYHFRFKNIQHSIKFRILNDNYSSKQYELMVLPKPIVLNFEVDLIYPRYIHKENEKLQNTGDLIVPYGTQILWKFFTRDTRQIWLRFSDKIQKLEQKGSNAFAFASTFLQSQSYSVTTFNEYLKNQDSLNFNINVIPDAYPEINAEEYRDSVYENRTYFKGVIKDDYGFNRLTFNYKIIRNDSLKSSGDEKRDTISINPSINQQQYLYYFDMSALGLKPGNGVEYYFEVWDNDGISGPKSTRSQKMFFKAPTRQEQSEKTDKASKKLKDEMEQSIKEARDLKKEIDELNRKLFEKKEIGYQEKKQIENLLQKQENLQKKVDQINKENKENSIREQQFSNPDEKILEKQQQLQDLFDKVIPEDMKKMVEDLQKMLENMDKNKVNEALDKMKLNSEDLEKSLDRNLELYKQLEFEKKLEDVMGKIDDLKEKQDKLAEETQKNNGDNKDLLDKQEDLNKEFDQLSKDMKDLEEKNKALEEPNQMPNTDKQQQDIKEDMKSGSENLKNKKNKKASQSQKSAAQKMENLSQQMKNMQQQMEGQDMEQDIASLRSILENLIQVSFDQEDIMLKTNKAKTYDPQYVKMIQTQKNIKDDLKLIEDSLFALSKRQAAIKGIVNKEINEVNLNIEKSLEEMTERRTQTAAAKQQLAMTGINNLALLLQESMDQLQKQSMEQKEGSGQSGCSGKPSPGKGKMSMKKMKEIQDKLGQEMEKMKEKMKNGQKPGQEKGNQAKQQGGEPGMSEQLARMAAQQEAVRKQLQDIRDQMAKEGKGNDGNLNKMIQDMEMNENDLVNKMITNQTLQRQKEILTRLLESEKSMREREQEERRESTEAKNQIFSNPKSFFEYNKIKSRETELLKTVPPTLKPFYKSKVSAYFYNFEEK